MYWLWTNHLLLFTLRSKRGMAHGLVTRPPPPLATQVFIPNNVQILPGEVAYATYMSALSGISQSGSSSLDVDGRMA